MNIIKRFREKFDHDNPNGKALVLIESDEYGGTSQRPIGKEVETFIQEEIERLAKRLVGEEIKLPQDVEDGYAPAEYEDIILEGKIAKRKELINILKEEGINIK